MKRHLSVTITVLLCALLGCTIHEPEQNPTYTDGAGEDSNAQLENSVASAEQEPPSREETIEAPTSRLGHSLKSLEDLISDFKTRTQAAKAFWDEKERSVEPATFNSNAMSLTIAPDGAVSLKRNGKLVSEPTSTGWSVYKWTDGHIQKRISGTRTLLDNMKQVGPNELMLWSSEKPFLVNVAITAKDRYFTFELLHVSNDPQTGDLNDDWPGHRVEFGLRGKKQGDGWLIHTVPLNPMSELGGRVSSSAGNGTHFRWPYPQWAQTEDRPQPQGAIAVYGFSGDEEHDDILADMWVAEPSLPRPNRANLKSWTRADVDAWLDHWVKVMAEPKRILDFSPHGKPENLYKIIDIMEKARMNRIALHNFNWQGMTPGEPNASNFPNGVEDVIKWREYCHARGIDMHFHGFGCLLRTEDHKYGRRALANSEGQETATILDGLGSTARGTLVNDVPKSQGEVKFLVKPDLDYYPGMKAGMLPYYNPPSWGVANSGLGNTFPPYMEKTPSKLAVGKYVYSYTVEVTKDNLWEITAKPFRSRPDALKAGTEVKFLLMHGGWTAMDSRSALFEQVGKEYATILNHFQSNDLYDGAGMTEDLGSWPIRKMTQIVFEHLDHPVAGTQHFGHFFRRFRMTNPPEYKGVRTGTMPVTTWGSAARASSLDHSVHGINLSVRSKDMSVRGNHAGISLDLPEKHGGWDEAMKAFTLWSELKPHLSLETKKMIASNSMENLFLATETNDQWQITEARAMRREGIDGGWQHIPERPQTAPRQALKVNTEGLKGLNNPYVSQVPEVQLHVGAGMTSSHQENLSLMPKRESDVIYPAGAEQKAGFKGGKFAISVDNTDSEQDYSYQYRGRNGEKNMHWLSASVGHPEKLDMSKTRGVAITVLGDGSGAILIFAAGAGFPRAYGVTLDFVGERTFEIPTGEYINSRAYWDVHHGAVITASSYHAHQFSLYLYRVPAGKKARVEVLDIQAMVEDHDTGLIDPVMNLNGAKATVKGTIPYNHYLVCSGGSTAKVYGPNWHFVKELPVTAEGALIAVNGNNTFSVNAVKSPNTWLSSRIKVADTASRITIQKPN